MAKKQIKERGAASIFIELNNGKISILHGTDKTELLRPIEVNECTWSSMFKQIKFIIESNAINSL